MAQQEEPKRLTFHTVQEVLTNSEPDPDWVIEGVAAKGTLTTIAGYMGAGKSPLMIRMARAIADMNFHRDRELCKFKVNPLFNGRVVYLTEEPRRSFEMALVGANLNPKDDLPFDVVFWDEAYGVEWEAVVEQAFHQADGGVIIVDTAFRWSSPSLSGGSAENDSATMQKVYGPLIQACRRNTTVIVSAHTRKDFDRVLDREASIDDVRGSGAVVASSSVVVLYKKPYPVMEENVRFLKIGRSRLSTPLPEDRYVTLTPEGLVTMSRLERELAKEDALDQAVLALVEKLGNVPEADLRKEWAHDNKELGSRLRKLVKHEKVIRSGNGRKGDPYTYSLSPFPPFQAPGDEKGEEAPLERSSLELSLRGGSENRALS
jgi:AAA domain